MCQICGQSNCGCIRVITKQGETGPSGPIGPTGKSGNGFLFASVSLSTAQIKTGSSVPIQIVPACATGYAIEVISGSFNYTYGTVSFTGTNLYLDTDTSTYHQMQCNNALSGTQNGFGRFQTLALAINTTQVVPAKGLFVSINSDSSVGDGSVIVYVCYRLIKL